MTSPWLILQLADSAFPTGGFAHSAGLEVAWQLGELRGSGGVGKFAREVLWQAGWGALPLVRAACEEPARLPELDRRAEVFLTNHVARRASATLGRAFLETTASVFPEATLARRLVVDHRLEPHLAPVQGAVASALGISVEEAQRLHLHQTLRGVLSAAVRLGITGPQDAQRLQRALAVDASEVLEVCGPLGVEALAQTAPHLEILSAAHDRLYSRLFQS